MTKAHLIDKYSYFVSRSIPLYAVRQVKNLTKLVLNLGLIEIFLNHIYLITGGVSYVLDKKKLDSSSASY